MDIYMYKYICPRWYGNVTGIRNIYDDSAKNESDIIRLAKKEANEIYGSKSCNISLLQKFNVVITSKKNYAGMAGIPLSIPKEGTIKFRDDDN